MAHAAATARAYGTWLKSAFESVALVFLPARKRRPTALVLSLHGLPRWSFAIGVLEMFVGVSLYGLGLIRYMRGFADQASTVFWEKAQSDGSVSFAEKVAFNWSGSLGIVSYLFTPMAWISIYIALEGVARFVGYLATREAIGCPAITFLWFVADAALGRRRRSRRLADLGVEVPDRLAWNPARSGRGDGDDADGWVLEIVSAREKPWRPEQAIQIGDEFFRFVGVEERRERGRVRLGYRLRRWPAHEILRSILVYEPPPGATAAPQDRAPSDRSSPVETAPVAAAPPAVVKPPVRGPTGRVVAG